ncbi:MAG: VWA domain-containing protein [Leptospiraceae bacterium]|nr:VWA domain-containing protein [Leptospiraceae bacterium]
MEWDQWLFRKIAKTVQKFQKTRKERHAGKQGFLVFPVHQISAHLVRLFYLITGDMLEIRTIPAGMRIADGYLYFPNEMSLLASTPESANYIKLCILLLSYSQPVGPTKGYRPLFQKIRDLLRDYPGYRSDYLVVSKTLKNIKSKNREHYDTLFSFLQNLSYKPSARKATKGLFTRPDQAQTEHPSKSESKKIAEYDQAELLEVDKEKIEQYTLGHNFEKIETAEEFDGQWRDLDGSDEMTEQDEALSEVKLRHYIRSDDPVHSTLENDRASVGNLEMQSEDEPGIAFVYDEWDFRKRDYKTSHCNVFQESAKTFQPGFAERVLKNRQHDLNQLKRKMLNLLNLKMNQPRLPSGDDFDFDALVDRYSELAAQKQPTENVYTRKTNTTSDIVLSFVIDTSLSTDSFADGLRILDIEKESIIIFCEALNSIGVPFQIAAFSSRTRIQNRYVIIKEEYQKWQSVRDKIGSLQPVGYTRIGPPLRHATELLKDSRARKRWIILLTDGRPNDYDKYEGRYGEEDVKQAIREMNTQGIQLYTLAIAAGTRPTIPRMMAASHYRVFSHPHQYLDSLEDFFIAVAK